MLRPLRFRTEQAIKVTMIGYFKVASGYHLLAILASKINKKGELLGSSPFSVIRLDFVPFGYFLALSVSFPRPYALL
jgi:hypothetical protein